MPTIEDVKSEAVILREAERAAGRPMTHSAALEQVARRRGYAGWRACRAALTLAAPSLKPDVAEPATAGAVAMSRYTSQEWNFSLDIPSRWNAFPAVPTNSPYEVVRFASHEAGVHLLIVFRMPYDPLKGQKAYAGEIQKRLAGKGFGNFTEADTAIGPNTAVTLDFDRVKDGALWSCRHYFLVGGTLAHALGFGTSDRDAMFGLYDRMAKSFIFDEARAAS